MTLSSREELEVEASRAPLLDHLVELRRRLIFCVIALIVGFGVCFYFAQQLYSFLLHPFERGAVGSSRVDLQACKLEYSIVSPK